MENEFVEQSKTKVPMRTKWFFDNKERLNEICEFYNLERKTLYHLMLLEIGKKYNLEAAKKIFENELGYPPAYAMDIVGYFHELEEMANRILDRIESNIYGE